MRPIVLKATVVTTALLLLMLTGCVEREETITVHPDGSTTIRAQITGTRSDFRAPLAWPSAPTWTIIEDHVDTAGKPDSATLKRTAEITIPAGMIIPQSYAEPLSPGYDMSLHFPTEVKHWTENGRDYYEFKRTYRARRFGCYNLVGSKIFNEEVWDQDLEDRVLDKGIFNVSEEDRDKYLDQFGTTFGYMQWRFLWQALGDLRHQGVLDNEARSEIESAAGAYLDTTLAPDRLLAALKQKEDPDSVLTDLTATIRNRFRHLVHDQTGPDNAALMSAFMAAQDRVLRDFAITEALGGQSFSVDLELPGEVIDANGLVDPDHPGGVHWEFDGNALHDVDLPLYALSVVDHRGDRE